MSNRAMMTVAEILAVLGISFFVALYLLGGVIWNNAPKQAPTPMPRAIPSIPGYVYSVEEVSNTYRLEIELPDDTEWTADTAAILKFVDDSRPMAVTVRKCWYPQISPDLLEDGAMMCVTEHFPTQNKTQ